MERCLGLCDGHKCKGDEVVVRRSGSIKLTGICTTGSRLWTRNDSFLGSTMPQEYVVKDIFVYRVAFETCPMKFLVKYRSLWPVRRVYKLIGGYCLTYEIMT
jgi:hypothetical protein